MFSLPLASSASSRFLCRRRRQRVRWRPLAEDVGATVVRLLREGLFLIAGRRGGHADEPDRAGEALRQDEPLGPVRVEGEVHGDDDLRVLERVLLGVLYRARGSEA